MEEREVVTSMGRPKKSDMGSVPTEERILQKALELFALKGYDAVSVRDITTPLGLNQATLYIYYKNKAALLDAIFRRLEEKLINPGFSVPPPEFFAEMETFDLATFLIAGAKRFFGRTDQETRFTWRLLMMSQYQHEVARHSMEIQVLDAPMRHFAALLDSIKAAGLIKDEVDTVSAGRIIATMFFEYSFRANLAAAWEEKHDHVFDRLCEDLRAFADLISV